MTAIVPHPMTALKQLGVAALYALLTWVVLAYIIPTGSSSIFFLASGVALAAVLIGGKRYAWGILLGALSANIFFGYPLGITLLKSCGSTLGALLGAWLIERNGKFDPALPSFPDYLRLIVLGGFGGSSLSALIGSISLLNAGILTLETWPAGWLHWWMGDVLGVILVAPLALLWRRGTGASSITPLPGETLLIVGTTWFAGQIVLMGWFSGSIGHLARSYWLFLFIAWAAVRLNTRWTALLITVIALQGVLGAYRGDGFFARDLAATQLLSYWFFIAILSLVGMMLATHLTQRQQAETKLHRHTDELGLRNRMLQKISHGTALHDALYYLAHELERLNPGMLCSILLMNKAGTHLRHGAAPSLPDFYTKAIDGMAIGEGVGSCGTAVQRNERVIVEDIRKHPYWATYTELAQRANVRSCWSQPIVGTDKRVLGAFAIYHRRPASPSAEEISLIERMADFCSSIIEQTRIQDDLRLTYQALNATANAIMITDKEAHIQWVNHAFCVLTGYTLQESIGQRPQNLVKSGKQNSAFYKHIWDTLLAGKTWHGELINRRKDGTEYHEEMTITPVKNTADEITHFIAVKQDVTERKQVEQRIRALAFHDTLTQLPNRRLLYDRLEHAMATSKRSGNYGALMFIDLDNFKPLNDAHGHATGDLLLIEVARRLTRCVRETDTVARFGGDEFVVMLDELDVDKNESMRQAGIVAEKIRSLLAEPYLLSLQKEGKTGTTIEHRCTSSIGATLFFSHEASPDDIFRQADLAMYQAKASGRNVVRFFNAAA